ncbi:multiple sugar transport system permease protein [Catenuloplanes nepalensis]|uniref:Multiple sugar transport system permease protein n=1 Tax=Catenuloplanes nepalensis TaxID=587533 RepID=A0ABT9N082_9ACTN|nr:carbohydrate ABC transporter permease [Catenuloplanes nepalensis]MDP9797112.1 multiple sugar transport system permease protein [Catenuloplanes nepalensis]
MTALAPAKDQEQAATVRPGVRKRPSWLGSAILLIGAVYCLLPIAWVVAASTKNGSDLFTTFTFAPGTGFFENLGDLSSNGGGIYWQWLFNTAIYAGVGGALSALVSGISGYTLAKYRFAGRDAIFNVLLAGVLVPGITLAIPQYLLLAKVGLTDTYWSVLLPQIISPYGIYLARIYAAAAVPDTVVEAARTDGAGEFRIFARVALPMMVPGLVTVFLFQFVAIWNNFLLPFIMLSSDEKFPVTVGLFTLLNQGATVPALYSHVIIGSLLSIIPLIVLFLTLQRYWRTDLISGAVKG